MGVPQGRNGGRNRVVQFRHENGIASVTVKRHVREEKPGLTVHDAHLQRRFNISQVDDAWCADFTAQPNSFREFHVSAGRISCSNHIAGLLIVALSKLDRASESASRNC